MAGDALRYYTAIDQCIYYYAIFFLRFELCIVYIYSGAVAAGYYVACAVLYIIVDERCAELRLVAFTIAHFAGDTQVVRIDLGTLYSTELIVRRSRAATGRISKVCTRGQDRDDH